MAFRLPGGAKLWFKEIEPKFGTAPLFDMYYLCLMAGLATSTLKEGKDSESSELVDYFPAEYNKNGKIIIGLLLSRELNRLGIDRQDKTALNEGIATLVDPNTPSRLKSEGMRLMNRYANGGFEVLEQQWFVERPQHIEAFLPLYYKNLNSNLK